jgi:hypothetical protein
MCCVRVSLVPACLVCAAVTAAALASSAVRVGAGGELDTVRRVPDAGLRDPCPAVVAAAGESPNAAWTVAAAAPRVVAVVAMGGCMFIESMRDSDADDE